jgi:hypothetical protein
MTRGKIKKNQPTKDKSKIITTINSNKKIRTKLYKKTNEMKLLYFTNEKKGIKRKTNPLKSHS